MQSISHFHSSSSVSPLVQSHLQLRPFDLLMLKTTCPATPMVIVACIILEEGANMENLSSCARTMAGLFERLRCRIVDNRWVEAEEFKVSEHLFEMTVSPPETITSVLGDFVSEMLPEDRPLWHMTLVHDKLAKRDMVIFRSHHAVGDGLSLVQMMNWIFDIQTKEAYSEGALEDIESGLRSSGNSMVYQDNRPGKSPRNSLTSEYSLRTANSITETHTDEGGSKEGAESSPNKDAPHFASMVLTNDDDDEMGFTSGRESSRSQTGLALRDARGSKIVNYPSSTNLNIQLGTSTKSFGSGENAGNESVAPENSGQKKEVSFDVDRHGMFSSKKQKKTNVFYFILRLLYLALLTPFRFFSIILMSSDPPNILKVKRGEEISLEKSVAMSQPIDLDRIKNVGRAINGTVNDVVVATTALAIRNFMLERFDNDESKLPSFIRCILPISLRAPVSKNIELDNRISAVFLSLPLREQNPKKMLVSVKRQTDRLKSFPDAFIVYGLIAPRALLVYWLPTSMFMKIQYWFYSKCTILLSNVPGRRKEGYFGGSKVKDMCFWVPMMGSGAVGLSIYSYVDHVVFSCLSDPEVLDSPSTLCEEYVKAFDHLERMVLGKNFENRTEKEIHDKTVATLAVTRVEERSRRDSKRLEQSINVARGVAQAKAARRASKARAAKQLINKQQERSAANPSSGEQQKVVEGDK